MCFAMQEPMKNNQDIKDKEVIDDQLTPESAHSSEDVSNEEQATTDVDPWEQLEIEVAKWKDQAIRKAAELENYRKRMSREKLDALRYGNQRLLEELLPVLDNFDMGMQAAAKEEGSMLYMGMDMVHKQIGEFLTSQGVTEIPAEVGGDFDPNLHEAISQETSDEIEADKIIQVIRKGYKMGDRLLRPANVIVSLGAHGSEAGDESTEETQTESE